MMLSIALFSFLVTNNRDPALNAGSEDAGENEWPASEGGSYTDYGFRSGRDLSPYWWVGKASALKG